LIAAVDESHARAAVVRTEEVEQRLGFTLGEGLLRPAGPGGSVELCV